MMDRVVAEPRYERPHLTPLSAGARQRRRPPSPSDLVNALQDKPEVRIKALPKRFTRPPKAKKGYND